ncbi:MAG: hypothetical protein WD534_15790 [Phycisphaeraceae bacterium]
MTAGENRLDGVTLGWVGIVLVLLVGGAASAAELELVWPLEREAYQTNERVDLTVIRRADAPLPAGDLTLTLRGEGGSVITCTWPVNEVAADEGAAERAEHLHLHGWLLRPGRYEVQVAYEGASASGAMELHSHVRQSPFRLVAWNFGSSGEETQGLGERSLGYNLLLGAHQNNGDDAIRAGVDYMKCCAQGGGHQLDLRRDADWSDPRVIQAAVARSSRQALADRNEPNALGVHFHDEPTLVPHDHPVTGEHTFHSQPTQRRAYKHARGREPIAYHEVDGDDPADVAQWAEWGRWRMRFMEAAWKHSAHGVHDVRPDMVATNQTGWLWNGWTHGYYFNTARPLGVLSTHGAYDPAPEGYYAPTLFFEFSRMRKLDRPHWHLPTWFLMPPDRFRLEQYLSFQHHATGMGTPPWMQVYRPQGHDPNPPWCPIQPLIPTLTDGVVASNKLMARLGTIFFQTPVHRSDAAVLYALSHNLRTQARNMADTRSADNHATRSMLHVYIAAKMAHFNLHPIVEEDVLDGSLAAHHKAVLLPSIDYLDPAVIATLEAYIRAGGTVITTDDCQVQIDGATPLGAAPDFTYWHRLAELEANGRGLERARLESVAGTRAAASNLVAPIREQLTRAGVRPVLESDNPQIIASRQPAGEIEYIFATNGAWDAGVAERNALATTQATLSLRHDAQHVYDAVLSQEITPTFERVDAELRGRLRFGPGQMRVFALTERPIGGVRLLKASVSRDYTRAEAPVRLDLAAALVDDEGAILAGVAPMRIIVTDPLGKQRYDLYRASHDGMLSLALPLAANDPAGDWTFRVEELLSGRSGEMTFPFDPPAQSGAVAGTGRRALHLGDDRQQIFRFFHDHEQVTIVAGSSEMSQAAAERLKTILEPWDVRARIMPLEEASRPRSLTQEEAQTWIGLHLAAKGQVKAGDENQLTHVGFQVQGPVILVGNPEDNQLIAFADREGFLPYRPQSGKLPGPGRGLVCWQRDAVGYGQASVAVIAHDAAGMAEAVGTLYEAAAGLDPPTPWHLPQRANVTPAHTPDRAPSAGALAWQTLLPDRVAALAPLDDGGAVALSQDGTVARLTADGSIAWRQSLDGGEYWYLDATPDGNTVVVGATQRVVVYDGDGRQRFVRQISEGGAKTPRLTFVAVSDDGRRIAAGAAAFSMGVFLDTNTHAAVMQVWDNTGELLWQKGDADPAAQDQGPIYRNARFIANGRLVGATGGRVNYDAEAGQWLPPVPGRVDVLDAASGETLGQTEGVNGWLGLTPTPRGVALLDGRDGLTVVSHEDGARLARLDLPETSVVALAALGDGWVMGSEIGGKVWHVNALDGDAAGQTAWRDTAEGLLVKRIVSDGRHAAVAYWGGTLRVYDAAGRVQLQRVMEQDIAALTWSGNRLVVGLADGRVAALNVPGNE